MDDNISTFIAITGANADVARSFLEMTAGNFERAIELFYENPDLASGVGAGLSANTAPTNQPAPAPATDGSPAVRFLPHPACGPHRPGPSVTLTRRVLTQ